MYKIYRYIREYYLQGVKVSRKSEWQISVGRHCLSYWADRSRHIVGTNSCKIYIYTRTRYINLAVFVPPREIYICVYVHIQRRKLTFIFIYICFSISFLTFLFFCLQKFISNLEPLFPHTLFLFLPPICCLIMVQILHLFL